MSDDTMSGTAPGEGWWLASDGRWYPPTSRPAPPAPPPTWNPTPPMRVGLSSTLSGWLQALLWGTAALAGIAAGLQLAALAAFNEWWAAPTSSDFDEFAAWVDADDALGGAAGFALVVWLATFVVLVVWMNQAHKATDRLGPGQRQWTSGWTVGGWFIPLAQFVIPKLVLNEIERIATAPRQGPGVIGEWRRQPTSALGWWWWLGLIAAIVANTISSGIWDETAFRVDPDDVRAAYGFGAAGFAAWSAASVCAVFYVRRLAGALRPEALTPPTSGS